MLLRVWQFFCATVIWLWVNSRGFKLHSSLHRALYDRKYAATPVAVYGSMEEIAAWMRPQLWVQDDWTQLWDAWCTPNKVQAVGQGGDHNIGDCDEFALYIAAATEKSLALGTMKPGTYVPDSARVLTVMWTEGVKFGGHNVALLAFKQITDGTTWFAYMDYGLPSLKRRTVQEVVEDVRAKYAPKSLPLGWCVQTHDLALEEYRFLK